MKNLAARITHLPRFLFGKFKSLSTKKKILLIAGLIILFIIISQVISNATKKPPYTEAVVAKGDVLEIVTETGNIQTTGRTDIYSPTNGVVDNVYVANGEGVVEGQELFSIKSTATEQEQKNAYANYLAAVASANSAKSTADSLRAQMYAEWDSFRNLATNDTYENGDGNPNTQERESAEFQIAQDQWKASEAKYKDQQTVQAQAQAQISSTWLLYQATQNATVKAPISGTVSNLAVALGSSVSISTPTKIASPVLVLSETATTEVIIPLSETDIAKVKPGQDAAIEISAVSDKIYRGVVTRVDDIGTDVQGVVEYNVFLEILDPDERLRPGMTADVDITTKKLTNVLTVPNAAVKPYQGGRAVRVFDTKTKEVIYIPVEIGTRGESNTEIIKGLTEGQTIITALSNDQLQRPGLFGN